LEITDYNLYKYTNIKPAGNSQNPHFKKTADELVSCTQSKAGNTLTTSKVNALLESNNFFWGLLLCGLSGTLKA
jgi:hypothetical protein